jgi:HEAT repeats
MRNFTLSVISVCIFMTGCESAAPPVVKTPSAETSPKVETPPKEEPLELEDVTVTPIEFESVAAALEHLEKTLAQPEGSERNREELRCEKWLSMQQDKAIPKLAEIIQSEKASLPMRITACRIITLCGNRAIPELLAVAKKCDSKIVQKRAIDMINRFKPRPPEVLEMHLQFIKGTDADLLRIACENLGRIGEPAKAAATRLAELREKHDDEAVRRAAGEALKKVNPRKNFNDK